ncbi:Type II toxin-antitoxin system HicA family toxin [Gammaproteobacteria bacterium]
MSTHEKILARMRNNPRDWRIDDLKAVADWLEIDWRNEGGSHHVFSFPGVEEDVCVPAHRPIKPVYVRQFVALCDKAKALQQ